MCACVFVCVSCDTTEFFYDIKMYEWRKLFIRCIILALIYVNMNLTIK
jgi:hypothetical protein